MLGSAALMAVVMLPAIPLWIGRPADAGHGARQRRRQPPAGRGGERSRSPAFWSVAAPFALALTAQVGFLVHQIAALEPVLGRAAGWAFGRDADGMRDPRPLRRWARFANVSTCAAFAAWSLVSQAVALVAIT